MRPEPGRQLVDVARDLESRHAAQEAPQSPREGGRVAPCDEERQPRPLERDPRDRPCATRCAPRTDAFAIPGRCSGRGGPPWRRCRRAGPPSRSGRPRSRRGLGGRSRCLARHARRRLRSARDMSRRAERSSWPCPTRDGGLRATARGRRRTAAGAYRSPAPRPRERCGRAASRGASPRFASSG